MTTTRKKLTTEQRAALFARLGDVEHLKARRAFLRAQAFDLIGEVVDSDDEKVRKIAIELADIEGRIAEFSMERLAAEFGVARSFAPTLFERYMNGASIHGRSKCNFGRKWKEMHDPNVLTTERRTEKVA